MSGARARQDVLLGNCDYNEIHTKSHEQVSCLWTHRHLRRFNERINSKSTFQNIERKSIDDDMEKHLSTIRRQTFFVAIGKLWFEEIVIVVNKFWESI